MTNFIFRSKVWKSGEEGESCQYYRYYLLQREGFEVRDTATFHRNIYLRPPPSLPFVHIQLIGDFTRTYRGGKNWPDIQFCSP